MRCESCNHEPCACPSISRAEAAQARETEAILEAYKWRELWEAAASCIQHNRKLIKPRGEDERRIIEAAEKCGCGHYWSGRTDGWLPEAEQMGLFEIIEEKT